MEENLLPVGFHDFLYPEAEIQAQLVHNILYFYKSYGYQYIDPTFVEFEGSYSIDSKDETFKVFDPISSKTMCIRSDITTQISRIARSSLRDENRPLRLAYSGSVLRPKSTNLHGERQLVQAGIEIIGQHNAHADAEVIILTVRLLEEIGIQDICIDFSLPGIINMLLFQSNFTQEEIDLIIHALNKKDFAPINNIPKAKIFIDLANIGSDITALKKAKLPPEAINLCKKLEEVINIINKKSPEVTISIDPSEKSRSFYHSGIAFSLFTKNARSELGRGGDYILDAQESVGFTIYINELFRILPSPTAKNRIFALLDADEKQIEYLRKEGNIIICALEDVTNPQKEASKHKCYSILSKKKLTTV